jgi:hypothetical protein
MFSAGGGQPQGAPQSQLRPLLIVIELGPDFPVKAPRIIAPNERHRLIDPSTFVILPQAHVKLANWTPHTELGKLVWEIYKTTFTTEPPIPVGMENHPASPGSRHPASPGSYPYSQQNPGYSPNASQQHASPQMSFSPSHQQQHGGSGSGASSNVPSVFPEIESLRYVVEFNPGSMRCHLTEWRFLFIF